ncbi:CAAX protease self-immunity [Abditibacterium utsteinense]|uniref:CAAX protease self-immunity n=1 Tax=Abditibacterium utsteinense TaxID=1960156 RepID=A0A2S8SQD6_9BACT|nr:CPBP family intramembrane glutamic endopeptidase [Abditibacterium utsteinense]PQV63013.1 CAAX protease self-immunity [Abditibacterium utsteinense]
MNSEFQPIASPTELPIAASPPLPTENRVARWRWWVSLLVIASSPLLAALSSTQRTASPGNRGALLPKSVMGLLLFCAIELGAFGVMWGIAWAFSRANRDQLFLRWRGAKSLLWGVGYSLLMRFGIVFVAIFIFIALSIVGVDSKAIAEVVKSSGDNVQKVFSPIFAGRDPLYKMLVIALISFVVAGGREELWRAATMAGIFHLVPHKWSQATKNGLALGLSSALFGMGHLYQGAMGVFGTTLLGVALGAIMLRHKSVWPAIIAHGCFDAVSFAALAFGAGIK